MLFDIEFKTQVEAENKEDAILEIAEIIDANPDLNDNFKAVNSISGELPTDDDIELVKKAANITNYNAVGEHMARLLMDTNVNTYDMYEELSTAYINHADNKAFIAGLNKACGILLWKNMPEVAKSIIENVEDNEEK